MSTQLLDSALFDSQSFDGSPASGTRDRQGSVLLMHEALARSRQQEARQAARRYALIRPLAAGRTWSMIARFAARRAARARAGAVPGL